MNIKLFVWSMVQSYTPIYMKGKKQKITTTVTIEHKPELEQEKPELIDVDGIGPYYSEKLKSIGISNVHTLASKSPKEISSKLNVSEEYANRWILSAKNLVK